MINFKGIIWNEEDHGMTFETIPVPEDMIEEATKWREVLLEAVADYDDTLMREIL